MSVVTNTLPTNYVIHTNSPLSQDYINESLKTNAKPKDTYPSIQNVALGTAVIEDAAEPAGAAGSTPTIKMLYLQSDPNNSGNYKASFSITPPSGTPKGYKITVDIKTAYGAGLIHSGTIGTTKYYYITAASTIFTLDNLDAGMNIIKISSTSDNIDATYKLGSAAPLTVSGTIKAATSPPYPNPVITGTTTGTISTNTFGTSSTFYVNTTIGKPSVIITNPKSSVGVNPKYSVDFYFTVKAKEYAYLIKYGDPTSPTYWSSDSSVLVTVTGAGAPAPAYSVWSSPAAAPPAASGLPTPVVGNVIKYTLTGITTPTTTFNVSATQSSTPSLNSFFGVQRIKQIDLTQPAPVGYISDLTKTGTGNATKYTPTFTFVKSDLKNYNITYTGGSSTPIGVQTNSDTTTDFDLVSPISFTGGTTTFYVNATKTDPVTDTTIYGADMMPIVIDFWAAEPIVSIRNSRKDASGSTTYAVDLYITIQASEYAYFIRYGDPKTAAYWDNTNSKHILVIPPLLGTAANVGSIYKTTITGITSTTSIYPSITVSATHDSTPDKTSTFGHNNIRKMDLLQPVPSVYISDVTDLTPKFSGATLKNYSITYTKSGGGTPTTVIMAPTSKQLVLPALPAGKYTFNIACTNIATAITFGAEMSPIQVDITQSDPDVTITNAVASVGATPTYSVDISIKVKANEYAYLIKYGDPTVAGFWDNSATNTKLLIATEAPAPAPAYIVWSPPAAAPPPTAHSAPVVGTVIKYTLTGIISNPTFFISATNDSSPDISSYFGSTNMQQMDFALVKPDGYIATVVGGKPTFIFNPSYLAKYQITYDRGSAGTIAEYTPSNTELNSSIKIVSSLAFTGQVVFSITGTKTGNPIPSMPLLLTIDFDRLGPVLATTTVTTTNIKFNAYPTTETGYLTTLIDSNGKKVIITSPFTKVIVPSPAPAATGAPAPADADADLPLSTPISVNIPASTSMPVTVLISSTSDPTPDATSIFGIPNPTLINTSNAAPTAATAMFDAAAKFATTKHQFCLSFLAASSSYGGGEDSEVQDGEAQYGGVAPAGAPLTRGYQITYGPYTEYFKLPIPPAARLWKSALTNDLTKVTTDPTVAFNVYISATHDPKGGSFVGSEDYGLSKTVSVIAKSTYPSPPIAASFKTTTTSIIVSWKDNTANTGVTIPKSSGYKVKYTNLNDTTDLIADTYTAAASVATNAVTNTFTTGYDNNAVYKIDIYPTGDTTASGLSKDFSSSSTSFIAHAIYNLGTLTRKATSGTPPPGGSGTFGSVTLLPSNAAPKVYYYGKIGIIGTGTATASGNLTTGASFTYKLDTSTSAANDGKYFIMNSNTQKIIPATTVTTGTAATCSLNFTLGGSGTVNFTPNPLFSGVAATPITATPLTTTEITAIKDYSDLPASMKDYTQFGGKTKKSRSIKRKTKKNKNLRF